MMSSYTDETRANVLFSKLQDYRTEKQYIDVTIETDGMDFPAHRMVLASSSPYWNSAFNGGFMEESKDVLSLKHIKSEIFHEIISYIYSGTFHVNADNVTSLFAAADYLHHDYVKQCCLDFIKSNFTPTSCLAFMEFAVLDFVDSW